MSEKCENILPESRSHFTLPSALKYHPSRLMFALGLIGLIGTSCSTSTPKPPNTAIQVQAQKSTDANGFITSVASKFTLYADYCKNPNAQDSAGVVMATNQDRSEAVEVSLKAGCKPEPYVTAKSFTLVTDPATNTKVLTPEVLDIEIEFGDTVLATLQENPVGDWQTFMVDQTNNAHAESNVYKFRGTKFKDAVILDQPLS